MALVEMKGIKRYYDSGDGEITVKALDNIDLKIQQGEFVAVMGASGSGKTTLMNIMGCLDHPTGGSYFLEGTDITKLDPDQIAEIRNRKIGFVFQSFNLLARTTALENVELPLLYRREKPSRNIREIAKEMLERVGLGGRLHHLPSQLSGGQQQRVALARALVNNPSLILADEPTGNLDTEMSLEVMAIFQDLHEAGITIVMVTHEPDIAQFTRRKVQFRDGKVLQDQPIPNPPRADEVLQQWKKEHAL
ncbi:MAG TPA: ABC transporter ATP-binding protein [Spirochaetales bacterium]|nr:ABC transporter ATP-binding protein [Spirochaetales bacterium]